MSLIEMGTPGQRSSFAVDEFALARAGWLAGYSGGTRRGYATELRLWAEWCDSHGLDPLNGVRRPHVELYARELEEVRGRKRSTVGHKLSCLARSIGGASSKAWPSGIRSLMLADRRSLS
jgi:hypothetical protein